MLKQLKDISTMDVELINSESVGVVGGVGELFRETGMIGLAFMTGTKINVIPIDVNTSLALIAALQIALIEAQKVVHEVKAPEKQEDPGGTAN